MKILVTGAAGFIGYHTCQKLLQAGHEVHGLDSLNEYYSVDLKNHRLQNLSQKGKFHFHQQNIVDNEPLDRLFEKHGFEIVINLAAQAGVRHSIDKPYEYIDANLIGFINILEACRHHPVKHLIFASSSSVYGDNRDIPFSVHHHTDHPLSLYAATKKANEMMAHSYSALYNIPVSGVRFFTVYGPWGRPDMAYYKFAKAIYEGKEISLYNQGKLSRDFTYIEDIVEGIHRLTAHPPKAAESTASPASSSSGPFALYNIGNNSPIELMEFVKVLEMHLGKQAKIKMLPMQPGDVHTTYADVSELTNQTGYHPSTSLKEGLKKFIEWFEVYEYGDRSSLFSQTDSKH